MADLRDRDHAIYDSGRPDPYHRYERRAPRFLDDMDSDDGRSDGPRRSSIYRDEPPFQPPLRRAPSPDYYDDPRRVMIDRERERGRSRAYARDRSPSPAALRRPGVLRRQSSLDTYDRPRGNDLHFLQREEYGPPARREDVVRYGSPPLSSRAAPLRSPDRYARFPDHDHDHDGQDDDDFGSSSAARRRRLSRSNVSDRPRWTGGEEVVRVGSRRSRDSVTSRTFSRSSGSGSSESSAAESSPSRGTSARGEYPKKGKTKIPGKMVSKRALIDLGYLFVDEGKNVIILKALGQDQIDQVLRVSEEYKKAELEVSTARSSAGNVEDRRDEFRIPPHMHVHPPPALHVAAPPRDVDFARETIIRDVSPSSRSYATTTSYPPTLTGTSASASTMTGGPLALRSRSRSRPGREIRAEIRALEAELREEKRLGRHRRHRSGSAGGDVVRVDRVGDGQQQAVIFEEEKVEKVDEGYRGPRIERDRRGRLSLSVPKRR